MTYTPDEAKPLLSSEEYGLFSESFDPALSELSVTDLKLAVRRCRAARDKFQELYQRQAIASREALEARGEALDANERTADKANVFIEALARYEERLAALS